MNFSDNNKITFDQSYQKKQPPTHLSEKNLQVNFQKKQNRAKHNLFQIQDYQKIKLKTNRTKPGSIINGWTEQFQYYNQKYQQLCFKQNNIKVQNNSNNKLKYLKTQDSQNLIPKLKELLVKLQSPQKEKSPQNIRLLHMEVLRQIKDKRRQSLKVAEIIKSNQNKNMNSIKKERLQTWNEALKNSSNRLNTNISIISKTSDILNYNRRIKTLQRNEIELIHESEVIRLIKKKQSQLKELKKLNEVKYEIENQKKNSIEYDNKRSFHKKKMKQKITLTNLIKI